ncbi:MAG: DUF983 domain-containing protein [Pseudomonadota bacterium]|nr:DUF983 domain-containing protein [Pseudomonadota bacterium]
MTPDADAKTEGQPGITRAALLGLCPRCGGGKLFAGVADFAPSCAACGLNFAGFNVGDGPAAFLTMIVGALIVLLALWMHFSLLAPMWLLALMLVPLTAVLVIWGLRLGKAALLAAEFQRRAGEFQSHGQNDGQKDGIPKP